MVHLLVLILTTNINFFQILGSRSLAPEHLKNAVENLQKVVTNWTHPVKNKMVKNS